MFILIYGAGWLSRGHIQVVLPYIRFQPYFLQCKQTSNGVSLKYYINQNTKHMQISLLKLFRLDVSKKNLV
jgi:hypothetical protein